LNQWLSDVIKDQDSFASSMFCPNYQFYLRLFSLKVIRVVAGTIMVVCFFVLSGKKERERYRDRLAECFSRRARNFLFGNR